MPLRSPGIPEVGWNMVIDYAGYVCLTRFQVHTTVRLLGYLRPHRLRAGGKIISILWLFCTLIVAGQPQIFTVDLW